LTCAEVVEACSGQSQTDALMSKFSMPKASQVTPEQLAQYSGKWRYFCTRCRTHTSTAKRKGIGWIEVVLYFFWILPGLIYSIWRRHGEPNACPTCGHAPLILAESGEISSDTHIRCTDCAELVRREAKKCKHCGCALVPQS
jgi:hypothetical protein